MSVRRIFVEKKPDYAVKAGELREELESYLDIKGVKNVRVLYGKYKVVWILWELLLVYLIYRRL